MIVEDVISARLLSILVTHEEDTISVMVLEWRLQRVFGKQYERKEEKMA